MIGHVNYNKKKTNKSGVEVHVFLCLCSIYLYDTKLQNLQYVSTFLQAFHCKKICFWPAKTSFKQAAGSYFDPCPKTIRFLMISG